MARRGPAEPGAALAALVVGTGSHPAGRIDGAPAAPKPLLVDRGASGAGLGLQLRSPVASLQCRSERLLREVAEATVLR
ncbi:MULTISPECIES: hypothetical protein [Mycobacterium]|uniref:Uncharacterized protein n=1 Tax=Mycobacterium pseudoshottsii TaxID=265949 RepID=A0A9N7LUA1_9MYCO|nr:MULTISPECIES: hypothetical protein [Mycobacterium]EPQ46522.1 secreted protein [Mycobacterium sp. 012931]MDC8982745.1 hypothetical protein [Mycobacterium marinum]MDC8993470.1 hypothetical protein [Mycobacterium marinum]MDC8999454.1 hypothetical protein [Mycobacterium marinum]MDC9010083.1 hypothetical protein [Mycobacterium marinum]